MPWERYWQTSQGGIEETEERIDRTWALVLALLVASERRLRTRTVSAAFAVPTDRDGRYFDGRDRAALMRFRAGTARDVDGLVRELGSGISGLPPNAPTVPDFGRARTYPRRGIVSPALVETSERHRLTWDRMERHRTRDERSAPPRGRRGPDIQPQPAPPADLPDDEHGDVWEAIQDSRINILRNLGYGAFRFMEDVHRRTGPHAGPRDVVDLANGSEDPRATGGQSRSGEPWRLHRGHMRLSSTAHIRGLHRRRTVTLARRAGITHFRLDVPRRRLGRIAPGKALGRHLWRVRTLDEWHDIHRMANRARSAGSAGLDSLGLGFGDVSYVTPVPAVYLEAAVEQGRRLRARWLAAAAIAAASGSSGRRRREVA